MKSTDAKHMQKLDVHRVGALLALAIVACRDSVEAQLEWIKLQNPQQPHTPRFAAAIQKQTDIIDFATTALAGQLGWPLHVGEGGVILGAAVPTELAEAAQRWVARGRKDQISA